MLPDRRAAFDELELVDAVVAENCSPFWSRRETTAIRVNVAEDLVVNEPAAAVKADGAVMTGNRWAQADPFSESDAAALREI